MLQFTRSRSWSSDLGGEASRAESDGMSITVNQRLPDLFEVFLLAISTRLPEGLAELVLTVSTIPRRESSNQKAPIHLTCYTSFVWHIF